MTTTRYTIELTTPAGRDGLGRGPEVRLRQALKRLGRDYGLRCTRIAADPATLAANQAAMHAAATGEGRENERADSVSAADVEKTGTYNDGERHG